MYKNWNLDMKDIRHLLESEKPIDLVGLSEKVSKTAGQLESAIQGLSGRAEEVVRYVTLRSLLMHMVELQTLIDAVQGRCHDRKGINEMFDKHLQEALS